MFLPVLFILGSDCPSKAQPCRCPSPARTTTWKEEMETTASRVPPAPTWWTKPGPSFAPWPLLLAALAPSLHATSHSKSQQGNIQAWSTGLWNAEWEACILCCFERDENLDFFGFASFRPQTICTLCSAHFASEFLQHTQKLCCSYIWLRAFIIFVQKPLIPKVQLK